MREKLSVKSYFISIIAALLITDLTIFLDIPALRQILSFICFTTIPGLLILHIFRLDKTSLLKKFLLAVGLSISFLMFIGLLTNTVLSLVGYSKPLSTTSLTISFSIVLAALCFVAYWRNRESQFILIPKPGMNDKKWLLWPLLFPLLFPLLSILGTHLMNIQGNNTILMVMLFLIPAYIIALVCLNKRVHQATYPLAIGMISVALLLMKALTSNYLLGVDNYAEYNIYQIVSHSLNWNAAPLHNGLTACLSVSLLPTVYQSLLGITDLSVLKVIYPLIASITPLACYVLFRRYLNHLYAFLSAAFFMAQLPFIYIL